MKNTPDIVQDELFKQRADAISELHSIQQETVQAQEKVAEETRKLTKTQLHAERRIDRLKQEIEDVGLDKLENEIQEEQEVYIFLVNDKLF